MTAALLPDFDLAALHAEFRAAVDREGAALHDHFTLRQKTPKSTEAFKSRLEAHAITISSRDPVSELTDGTLRQLGWLYYSEAQEYVIQDEGYRALRKFVEKLRRRRPFAEGFSDKFLERSVVDWCRGETATTLSDHLLQTCSAAYEEHLILIPLTHVEIEHDFALGQYRLVTIDPDFFIRARDAAREKFPDKPDAGKGSEDLGRQFGHSTAVEIKLRGEGRYVRERAMEIAHDVAGVLRFLSPAPAYASVHSPVQPHGYSALPMTTIFRVRDASMATFNREYHHFSLANWKLSGREIERFDEGPLSNLHRLFDGEPDSDYVAHFRNAFFAYCRALGRFELGERLVDTISALEALLLQNDAEGLQGTVADRLALLSTDEVDARIAVVRDYRDAYRLRSKAVHHLHRVRDEDVADRLMRHAFKGFFQAMKVLSAFEDRAKFFAVLESIKYSGSELAAWRDRHKEAAAEGKE